jgi:hypothetical protein
MGCWLAGNTCVGFEPVTQSLIDDYRKQLERLKAVALEHFQFHNGLE